MPGHAGRFDGAWTVARSAAVLVGVALASACVRCPGPRPRPDPGTDASVDVADGGTTDGSTADVGSDARVDAADASQTRDAGTLEDVAVTYVDAGACEAAGYTFRNIGYAAPPEVWTMGVGHRLFCDDLWVTFPAGARPFIAPYFGAGDCSTQGCSSAGHLTWTIALTQPWTAEMVRDLCQVEAQFGVLDWSCIVLLE